MFTFVDADICFQKRRKCGCKRLHVADTDENQLFLTSCRELIFLFAHTVAAGRKSSLRPQEIASVLTAIRAGGSTWALYFEYMGFVL